MCIYIISLYIYIYIYNTYFFMSKEEAAKDLKVLSGLRFRWLPDGVSGTNICFTEGPRIPDSRRTVCKCAHSATQIPYMLPYVATFPHES